MTIFDIRNIEKCFVMAVNLGPSNILRSKKAYGLEISESVLYVKDDFFAQAQKNESLN